MLRPLLLVTCLLASCQTDHVLDNIQKMGQLRARWDKIHPVTFPPLSEDEKRFVEAYSKQKHDKKSHMPSISEVNGAMADKLIEGDIIPSDWDIAELEERLRLEEERISGKVGVRREKRGAPVSNQLWDKNVPIPFILGSNYSEPHKTLIRSMIEKVQDSTCINFQENGPGLKLEYVFAPAERACSSQIGDLRSVIQGNQPIFLGINCLDPSVIVHETIHALGFAHTQTRTDRDDYVKVVDDNVKEEFKAQYDKLSIFGRTATNFGIPYEFSSIMHYSSSGGDFAIDPSKPILVPNSANLDYFGSIGGYRPLFNDWKMINIRYNCNVTCPTQIVCQNGGYQNPRMCEKCVCPQFHTGEHCEREFDAVTLTMGKTVLYTQPYNGTAFRTQSNHFDYGTYQKTTPQIIKAPEGSRIRVTIDHISDSESVRSGCPETCNLRALEIVEDDFTRGGKRFCCNPHRPDVGKLPYTFLSKGNVLGYLIYSTQGLDFSVGVTFSVEGATISPPTEAPTSNSTTTSTETGEPDVPTPSPAAPQTTHSGTRARRTDQPSTLNPIGSPQTTTDASAEKNILLDAVESLESLLSAVSEKFNRLVDIIHW